MTRRLFKQTERTKHIVTTVQVVEAASLEEAQALFDAGEGSFIDEEIDGEILDTVFSNVTEMAPDDPRQAAASKALWFDGKIEPTSPEEIRRIFTKPTDKEPG